jgi:FG-GAP-like repeat/Regulator of chromosome condensation (RCC1) repeat
MNTDFPQATGIARLPRLSHPLRWFFGTILASLAVTGAHAQSPYLENPQQLVSGAAHNCAITAAGGVQCWGANYSGQLGDGTLYPRTRPVNVVGLSSGVIAIASYALHTCAVLATGTVKCWGDNTDGQLGDGTTTRRTQPVAVTGITSSATAIAVSDSHSCAVVAGAVKCWGLNANGQLGNGTLISSLTPVDVAGVAGISELAAGGQKAPDGPVVGGLTFGNHTCARTTAGVIKCWGSNSWGQLGDGTDVSSTTAVNVTGIANAAQLVAGNGHSCVRGSAGGVKCWGLIEYPFSWGRGLYLFTRSASPIDVAGLTSGVTSISSGRARACALMSTETRCWGPNIIIGGTFPPVNQTPPGGNPLPAAEFEPGAQKIVAGDISANGLTTTFYRQCFVAQNGRTKCVGDLPGNGTDSYRATAVNVVPLNVFARSYNYTFVKESPDALKVGYLQPQTSAIFLQPGSGWTATAVGDFAGDGDLDFIANQADGTTAIFGIYKYLLVETPILLNAGSGYTVTLTGDFDGDGKTDIVLTNSNGSTGLLLMEGGTVKSASQLLPPGSPWRVTKAGDFNGDGKSDLIIEKADGTAAVLLMNGTSVVNAAFLLAAGSGWSVTHTADFDGDFKSDIVIRNTNGSTALLLMNGTAVASAAFLTAAGSPWTVVQTGDFNGDGKRDILLRGTNGDFAVLLMNGLVATAADFLPTQPSNTTAAQIGDYNRDGFDDILLRNANGNYTLLNMSGTTVLLSQPTSLVGTLLPIPQ